MEMQIKFCVKGGKGVLVQRVEEDVIVQDNNNNNNNNYRKARQGRTSPGPYPSLH